MNDKRGQKITLTASILYKFLELERKRIATYLRFTQTPYAQSLRKGTHGGEGFFCVLRNDAGNQYSG